MTGKLLFFITIFNILIPNLFSTNSKVMFRFWRKQSVNIDFTILEEEINRSGRFGYSFALIILELIQKTPKGIGRFIPGKIVSYQILKSHLRYYDKIIGRIVSRYCILMPQTTKEGLVAVIQRLKTKISGEINGRVCLGSALYPRDGESAQALISKAMEVK